MMSQSKVFLPPANEVCEGYVFTPVCHSVHRAGCQGLGGGWGVSLWGGVSRPRPKGRLGDLAGGGVVSRPRPGGSPGTGGVSQHALRQKPPPADGYCCGRYVSYSNAFLFVFNSNEPNNQYTAVMQSLSQKFRTRPHLKSPVTERIVYFYYQYLYRPQTNFGTR